MPGTKNWHLKHNNIVFTHAGVSGHCIVTHMAAECVCCSEINAIGQEMDETEADIIASLNTEF